MCYSLSSGGSCGVSKHVLARAPLPCDPPSLQGKHGARGCPRSLMATPVHQATIRETETLGSGEQFTLSSLRKVISRFPVKFR